MDCDKEQMEHEEITDVNNIYNNIDSNTNDKQSNNKLTNNSHNTLSGERCECAPSEWHNPLSPEPENGNDIMCNSYGNDIKCKTGMTQEGTLLTMITDTDYLNRDYKDTLSGESIV